MPEAPTYPPPLDRLHGLDLDEADKPAAVDYAAIGIGPEHIPALIEVAADHRYDTAMLPLAWAPVHAWRALGALRGTTAIEPLTDQLLLFADQGIELNPSSSVAWSISAR